jgi:hypothetical protein
VTELTQKDLKAIVAHIEYVNKLHVGNLESTVTLDIPDTITLSSGSKTLGTLTLSDYSDEYAFHPHNEKTLETRRSTHIPIPPPF